MEKLNRVICGLRECSRGENRDCTKCPYWNFPDYSCLQALRIEALELLVSKASEAAELLRGYLGDIRKDFAEEFTEEWDSIRKPDLISRQALLGKLEETNWYHVNDLGELVLGATGMNGLYRAEDVLAAVRDADGVEIVPVVRGQWIYEPVEFSYKKDIKCSVCGEYVENASNFCPHCGAKMYTERDSHGQQD